jgi:hypothetical protein
MFKPTVVKKGNCNSLSYNYEYSFQSRQLGLIFQRKIGGLTSSGRSFTSKELEKERKAKRKEVVDPVRGSQ